MTDSPLLAKRPGEVELQDHASSTSVLPVQEADYKRRKREDGSPLRVNATSWTSGGSNDVKPLPLMTPPSSGSVQVPFLPYLHHLAISAHHASSQHLQQLFIPTNIICRPADGISCIVSHATSEGVAFNTDSAAFSKAIALLLFSLDLLQLGLRSTDLSERDRVAFGLDFAKVSIKIIEAERSRLKTLDSGIDMARIWSDVRDVVGNSLMLARKLTYLKTFRQELELMEARLFFLEKRANAARKAIRQNLAATPRDGHVFRYRLLLLLLEFAESSATDSLSVTDELEAEAESSKHDQIVQLALLIRVRLLLAHRRWPETTLALSRLATILDPIVTDMSGKDVLGHDVWTSHLQVHYVLYKAILDGRSGDDASAKALMKTIYLLMDQSTEYGTFRELRTAGGEYCFEVPDLSNEGSQRLLIQLTPPNITYMMTYLASVTSRRDFLGSTNSCKSLVLSKMLRDASAFARRDDIWDVNFTVSHGIAEVLALRQEVTKMRVEVMLEEATTLMFRSNNTRADEILQLAIQLARENSTFLPFAPHFCLVHAQMAQLLGNTQTASRLYDAASVLLKPGSELGLLVEVSALAVSGQLPEVKSNPILGERVRSLANRCSSSTNSGLAAAGHFIASLLEENRIASKKRLSSAYDMSQRANNNVLRCLIFAFTTSVHLYGTSDNCFRQLETGRDLARLMGGKDREDGVGQLALGLWFAVKLKEYHRREGHVEAYNTAKASQRLHLGRLAAQKKEVLRLANGSI